ncbi:BTAD domain-containing putative transcriptional regulator [Streptomyces sp. 7-21]|uniref:BTAD domain-containing putative transcriptional regulator n=1 Tax=Streptomyces sp. 7-21 TaxID=2802283 RepID=UPI00191DDA0F|nr:BTAD domain-containing putative transcriptional regulator [Streptomyces sp. 7-21]MBL1065383.1 winged helix-turn-helix domain-containing protein [Streptomyces sp. 7-21]
MRIGVLGPLAVTAKDGRRTEIGGPRVRALLIRLALDAGRPVPAEALAAGLWGDAAPAGQANALQSLVSRLRRALPDAGLVRSVAGGYTLAVPRDAVDALRFEDAAAQARRALAASDAPAAARLLREALQLWRGPALADAGDAPFAAAPARRLAELRLAAREDLAEAELAAGRVTAAVADLEALVTEEPLRERARGLLMRARYATGRQADALAAYEEYRVLLAAELGADPSPGLRELHLALLRGDPALSPVPPARAGAAGASRGEVPGNLRAPLTSFVGRDEELRLIGKRLAECRLVTLVGPGGAGKTRLATTAAAAAAGDHPGGVWFTSLAPVTDPSGVPQAVLEALGQRVRHVTQSPVRVPVDRDPLAVLLRELPATPTLLVLDNCEHLIDAVAALADRLLGALPRLRILATSREPLGVPGEALCPVPPLPLPRPGAGAAEALSCPAVRLLADRAAAVRPGFAVTGANAASVVELCRRLDGLPLAIELAAARLRTFTPAQLVARLDDRFRLLTGGGRTAAPRHQTLRAVVAWSWELLSPDERRFAERLAVFAGSITPATAAPVAGVSAVRALDLLVSLADKSLLQLADDAGDAAEDDEEPRFRMLETLREYGAERLAARGALRAARDAHAACFLALAEEAEPRLRGPDQVRWIMRLVAERDNVLAALRHAAAVGDAATAVRLGAALGLFWTMRGNHREAASWLGTALAVPGESPPGARLMCTVYYVSNQGAGGDPRKSEESAAALRRTIAEARRAAPAGELARHPVLSVAESALALFTGRGARDSALGEEAVARQPDAWSRAMVRLLRGAMCENDGRPGEQRAELEAAAEGFRRVGDRWGLSMTLTSLGDLAARRGDLGAARAALEEARRLLRELRADEDGSSTDIRLAAVRARQGESEAARARLRELTARAEREGSVYLAVYGNLVLGDVLRWGGERHEAGRRYAAALAQLERGPYVQPQLSALARASASLTRPPHEAAALLRQALAEVGPEEDMPVTAAVGVGVAALCAARGQAERAARVLGAVESLAGMAEPGPEAGAVAARLRDRLGEAAYAAAYATGAALPRDQAVAALADALE